MYERNPHVESGICSHITYRNAVMKVGRLGARTSVSRSVSLILLLFLCVSVSIPALEWPQHGKLRTVSIAT